MSNDNLVLLRAEYFRLSRRYNEGNPKDAEMKKTERKLEKLRVKIQKLVA